MLRKTKNAYETYASKFHLPDFDLLPAAQSEQTTRHTQQR